MEKNFHKNPLYFRIYADFEAAHGTNNSNIVNKTFNKYKQSPVLNGYHIISELDDILQNGYHKSPLGDDNVERSVEEVIKLENKKAFYFKNTKKDTIVTKENEEEYKNSIIATFCEKEIISDKIRDYCHLSGKYRGPAHNSCNISVKQRQINFIPFIFQNFSNYDCYMFFKKLVIKNNDKIKFDKKPKTNEEYISVTYGCIRFVDTYKFLSSSLDSLVKTLVDHSITTLKNLKAEIVDNDEVLKIVNKIVDDKTFRKLKNVYLEKIEQLEEASINYMGKIDLKILKKGFPDKWNN